MSNVIELKGVSKEVGERPKKVILSQVDLAVGEGTHVAVRGRSGSGKSTLLAIIGGLLSATSGSIRVCGIQLDGTSEDARARFRLENVGFVFQSFHLLGRLNAWENVAVPLVLSSRRRGSWIEDRARQALHELGISDLAQARPAAMSGGQQQRVAIARALVTSPKLILADEPTGNLDEQSTADVLTALKRAREAHGASLIVVTHDPLVAATADIEVNIVDGRLHQRGV